MNAFRSIFYDIFLDKISIYFVAFAYCNVDLSMPDPTNIIKKI